MSLARTAFTTYVRRSSDAGLERTFGSSRGLRLLFARMARAYVPEEGEGLVGDLRFVLSEAAGRPERSWTVHVSPAGAQAAPGASPSRVLTLRLAVPVLVRIAAGEVDPSRALLDGRLDVEGDFGVVSRLGAMFGRPGAGVV